MQMFNIFILFASIIFNGAVPQNLADSWMNRAVAWSNMTEEILRNPLVFFCHGLKGLQEKIVESKMFSKNIRKLIGINPNLINIPTTVFKKIDMLTSFRKEVIRNLLDISSQLEDDKDKISQEMAYYSSIFKNLASDATSGVRLKVDILKYSRACRAFYEKLSESNNLNGKEREFFAKIKQFFDAFISSYERLSATERADVDSAFLAVFSVEPSWKKIGQEGIPGSIFMFFPWDIFVKLNE